MTRDLQLFPDDHNGDLLWGMLQSGDDLSLAREIEFTLGFQLEAQAIEFGEIMLVNRQKVLLADVEGEHPFEILVVVHMSPIYQEINDYENLLMSFSEPFNGKNLGWGCFSKA